MISIGIDPSLTRTAVAIARADSITVRSLPTKGSKAATLRERADRIEIITDWVRNLLDAHDTAAVVCIEGPSYGNTSGAHHDRSGLWWSIVHAIGSAGLGSPVEVPPSTLKMYATGKGNAGKDEVMLAMARRHDWLGVENNDEMDAAVLALIGARMLGQPIDGDLPQTHLRALAKLTAVTP